MGFEPRQVHPGVYTMQMDTEASLREYLKKQAPARVRGSAATSALSTAYEAHEVGCQTLRSMPARSPRVTNFSAILRLASSIISSPNITAPRRSPSVVAFS